MAVWALLAVALLASSPRAASAGNAAALNADGVLVIDGKKVFPIGFTMPPPPDGKTPTGKDAIQELADAGATFLRSGAMGAPWDEKAIAEQRKWLDAAAAHGMYCLVNLRELGSIGPNDARKEAILRRLLLAYRDHPGMGVYKHVDEPEWGKQPLPPMLRATGIVRELDPRHPIEITQAPRGTVASMRPYNAACDIVATDIYPVSYPPGTHSLLANREISMVGDYTRTMKELAGPDRKGVWMTLQIAWSGVVKPGKTLRFPTAAQERFMTYQAIINGARGLLYFGGSLPQAMTPRDRALGWNWRFWDTALRPVIEEIGSHSPLYPALVAPDSTWKVLPRSVRGGQGLEPGVEVAVREVGDDLFVLACKREGATVPVRFTGLPASAGEGEVLFESPRTVTARDGAFTDWFGPFDVHVYRFHRAKTAPPRPR